MKIIFLVITMLFYQLGISQRVDEILPKTLIFKMKNKYRSTCSKTAVDISKLNTVFAEIGLINLKKIFPNKLQEVKEGCIDLSLIYKLTYANSFTVSNVIKKISELNITAYVEPYYLPQLTYTPNDTSLSRQYYIDLINAENAWDFTSGDTNVIIGITDTGWDPTHPDLLGNIKINYADPINGVDDDGDGYIDNYLGWDLGMNDNNALWESLSHGVNVTGIAAAVTDNTTGISGVGFNSKFLPVKISNNVGLLTEAYQGVVYAADHDCFVINCSWGGYNSSQFAKDAIDYAVINKACLVVSGVGNDNSANIFYPAAYEGVFSVAATDQNDIKLWNSNFGSYVDISAPGGAIYTTGANGFYSTNSGTSMAAPIVSGGAALMKAQFPTYTNKQIITLLKGTADGLNGLNPMFTNKLGTGRINLFNAITNIIEESEVDIAVKLYPNPSKGIVSIGSEQVIYQIIIRNVLGEVVLKTSSKRFEITNNPSGLYFVQLTTDKGSLTKKLLLIQ